MVDDTILMLDCVCSCGQITTNLTKPFGGMLLLRVYIASEFSWNFWKAQKLPAIEITSRQDTYLQRYCVGSWEQMALNFPKPFGELLTLCTYMVSDFSLNF